MQQRHRVVDHAERRARDALQNLAAAPGRIDDLVPTGLDQKLAALLFGHRAHACESFAKRIERSGRKTVIGHLVLRVRAPRLGPHRTAPKPAREPQARLVLGIGIHQLILIGRCQVFIAAEHRHLHAVGVEHLAQMVGEFVRKAGTVNAKGLVEYFARQLNARETQFACHANALLDRTLGQVVQAHADAQCAF